MTARNLHSKIANPTQEKTRGKAGADLNEGPGFPKMAKCFLRS